jgi:hypothetical protein
VFLIKYYQSDELKNKNREKCNMYWEKVNVCTDLAGKLERKEQLHRWNYTATMDGRVWTGFIWLKTGSSGELL